MGVISSILNFGNDWPVERWASTYKYAYWILLMSLFAGALATAAAFIASNRVSDDLTRRLTKTTETAGEAIERAEVLKRQNLDLEQAVSPRLFEQSGPIAALKAFSDISFVVLSPSDFEPRRMAGQIRFVLWQAGWKAFKGPVRNERAFFDGISVSTEVSTSDPLSKKTFQARDALISSLNAAGIEASMGPPEQVGLGVIVLEVGPKPLPKALQVPSPGRDKGMWGNFLE